MDETYTITNATDSHEPKLVWHEYNGIEWATTKVTNDGITWVTTENNPLEDKIAKIEKKVDRLTRLLLQLNSGNYMADILPEDILGPDIDEIDEWLEHLEQQADAIKDQMKSTSQEKEKTQEELTNDFDRAMGIIK